MGFKHRLIVALYVYPRLQKITTIDSLHLFENLAHFTITIHTNPAKKNFKKPWYIGSAEKMRRLDARISAIEVSNSVMKDLIPLSRYVEWNGYFWGFAQERTWARQNAGRAGYPAGLLFGTFFAPFLGQKYTKRGQVGHQKAPRKSHVLRVAFSLAQVCS
jgi:hypothetical protein